MCFIPGKMQTGLLRDGFLVRASASGGREVCSSTLCSASRAAQRGPSSPARWARGSGRLWAAQPSSLAARKLGELLQNALKLHHLACGHRPKKAFGAETTHEKIC